jgi:hypothetical protein
LAQGVLLTPDARTSVTDIKILLQNNNTVLEQVAQRSYKLRQAHPKIRAPPSVFEEFVDDAKSVFTYNSTASSTNFSFDHYLVNAQAYRRALAFSRNDSSRKLSGAEDSGERSDNDTIINVPRSINDDEHSYVKMFKDALSTKDCAWFEVKKSSGSSHDEQRFECQEGPSYMSDIKERYQKVKKYYFEKENQVRQLENVFNKERAEKERVLVECAKEKAWLESRLEGLELTKAFLVKKIQDLEQSDENHKQYFQKEEAILTRQSEHDFCSVILR